MKKKSIKIKGPLQLLIGGTVRKVEFIELFVDVDSPIDCSNVKYVKIEWSNDYYTLFQDKGKQLGLCINQKDVIISFKLTP